MKIKPIQQVAAALSGLLLLPWGSPTLAQSTPFGQVEVQQDSFVAIATPFGVERRQYNLLIVQQLNNRQPCWREYGSNPTLIDPLLLNFDFTGICERSTDSNGYSLRIGNEDYGWRFILRLVQRGDEVVLVASSIREPNTRPIEIGRTHGLAEGYMKIHLDPGWRFTKRTYGGRTLGHVYLTADSLNTASPPPPPATRPVTNTPPPTVDREIIFTPPSTGAPAPLPNTQPP
ncbi:DUF3747 domain-containing protein, partial [Spirulina subsalsa FACHB-351]